MGVRISWLMLAKNSVGAIEIRGIPGEQSSSNVILGSAGSLWLEPLIPRYI